MESLKDLKHPQHYLTPATQKLIAQAWKIHMFQRMMHIYPTTNATKIFKRHQEAIKGISPEDIISCGTYWSYYCSDDPEDSVQVNFVEGSDIKCDCIDYPYDYVCKECKICIHMYKCSCQEVDEFPAQICRHVHAVCQFGAGVVQKPDIKKHSLTPHRTPGHKWPNPMVFRLHTQCKKGEYPKGLVAISSENINVDKDLGNGNYVLLPNWESEYYKNSIDQEKIRKEIMDTLSKRKQKGEDISLLFSKKTSNDDSKSQDKPADNSNQNQHHRRSVTLQQNTNVKKIKQDVETQTEQVLYLIRPASNSAGLQNQLVIPYGIVLEKKIGERSTQATVPLVNQINTLPKASQPNASKKGLQPCRGNCAGCRKKQPCGTCIYCRDMPRFGGLGIKKRKCLEQTCIDKKIENVIRNTTTQNAETQIVHVLTDPTIKGDKQQIQDEKQEQIDNQQNQPERHPANRMKRPHTSIKKPLNAFMIWAQKERSEISKSDKTMSHALISKQLGERWKMLSKGEQLPYHVEAALLKEQHQKKYPDYKPNYRTKADKRSYKKKHEKVGRRKIRHEKEDCKTCAGCKKKEACGSCVFCSDMKRFGGPGIKKKRCIEQRCINSKKIEKKHSHSKKIIRKKVSSYTEKMENVIRNATIQNIETERVLEDQSMKGDKQQTQDEKQEQVEKQQTLEDAQENQEDIQHEEQDENTEQEDQSLNEDKQQVQDKKQEQLEKLQNQEDIQQNHNEIHLEKEDKTEQEDQSLKGDKQQVQDKKQERIEKLENQEDIQQNQEEIHLEKEDKAGHEMQVDSIFKAEIHLEKEDTTEQEMQVDSIITTTEQEIKIDEQEIIINATIHQEDLEIESSQLIPSQQQNVSNFLGFPDKSVDKITPSVLSTIVSDLDQMDMQISLSPVELNEESKLITTTFRKIGK